MDNPLETDWDGHHVDIFEGPMEGEECTGSDRTDAAPGPDDKPRPHQGTSTCYDRMKHH